jgi:NAD(P)-dependent dehydrogenase (short-subunit alcohol dehydrogenase family)
MGALDGRRVLVAGGASGIGLATAVMCASAGAQVAVLDRNAWTGDPKPLAAPIADMRDTAAVDAGVAAAAAAMGGIDGLVYCPAIDFGATLRETVDADWERLLDINLTGAMRVCRAALRAYPPSGGTMVLVASAAGLRPLPLRSAYCSAKAGLVMFAKVLALELAEDNIRVNALCPGPVDTAMFRASYEGAADPKAELVMIRERYAMRRVADAEEIARCAAFLTGNESSFVTGSALAVDGGRVFH